MFPLPVPLPPLPKKRLHFTTKVLTESSQSESHVHAGHIPVFSAVGLGRCSRGGVWPQGFSPGKLPSPPPREFAFFIIRFYLFFMLILFYYFISHFFFFNSQHVTIMDYSTVKSFPKNNYNEVLVKLFDELLIQTFLWNCFDEQPLWTYISFLMDNHCEPTSAFWWTTTVSLHQLSDGQPLWAYISFLMDNHCEPTSAFWWTTTVSLHQLFDGQPLWAYISFLMDNHYETTSAFWWTTTVSLHQLFDGRLLANSGRTLH